MDNGLKCVELIRKSTSNDGTFGELYHDGKGLCFTLELPWRDNAKSVSCIPRGEYRCEVITRPSGERAYEIKGVPGRSAILIHPGNTTDDIKGCVLLGRTQGAKGGKPAVLDSKAAVADFMMAMGLEPFELKISGVV